MAASCCASARDRHTQGWPLVLRDTHEGRLPHRRRNIATSKYTAPCCLHPCCRGTSRHCHSHRDAEQVRQSAIDNETVVNDDGTAHATPTVVVLAVEYSCCLGLNAHRRVNCCTVGIAWPLQLPPVWTSQCVSNTAEYPLLPMARL